MPEGIENRVAATGLDRELFMRRLVASLGYLNEGILGTDVAGAYVLNVGLSMGLAIETEYKRYWGIERDFTLDEYTRIIIDLEQNIGGNFSLVSQDADKVVVETTSCPFDAHVRQSPSLCFMTSSVLGGIAARNFGYAKVVMHRRIALGDPGCYVTVHLARTPEAKASVGREYFPEIDRASPDIAEQLRLMDSLHRLRRQLGEVNARWEDVIHSAADAICVVGLMGKIAYANARWRDVLGVEGEELIGGEYERLVHPNDQQRARDRRKQAYRGERVASVSLRLRHRDGGWRDVLVSMGPVRDDDGRVIAVIDVVHDVTEERETQRLKDDFLTTASHELRTPVTTIKVLSEVLMRSLKTRGPIDQAQLIHRVEMIQRETDRLAALGHELLDVSRLQAGQLETRRERYDLNDIVEACVERQRELLGDSHAHAFVLLLAPLPLPVSVERTRVEQALINVLENAVKYSPEGGEIAITTQSDGAWARLSITDQGIGIPKAEQSRIFTPFYRGSNASAIGLQGLGLGLHLSRAVFEAHGGGISAHSSEGNGTTFTLSLPLDTTPVDTGPARTVLVVDDDEGFQETLQTLLEMEGYDVVIACDGVEALHKLDEVTPSIILLDVMMPRMDGLDFIRELERRGLRPAIPIVVLTADGKSKQKAEQIGAEGLLAKPFDVATLLNKVEQLTTTGAD